MNIEDAEPRRPRRAGAGEAKPREAWRGAPGKPASNLGSREVIVRVTGRTKSVRALGNQLAYNARWGRLDAEHSSGRVLHTTAELRTLRDRWAEENAVLARHPSCSTQSLGVVLSMPAGTDAVALRTAVVAWAHEHLTHRTEWLATVHMDRAHPHAHVAVRAVQDDGRRVDAGAAEVQRWRETFARGLRALGIEADATPRREKLERSLSRAEGRHERAERAPTPDLPGFAL